MARSTLERILFAVLASYLLPVDGARADDPSDAIVSVNGQINFVEQYHPAFRAPYSGPNSLDSGSRGDETFALSVIAGLHLWNGAEAYADPEVDQGFGLSKTLGVAGFPNGEAYRLGSSVPYFRLQRLYLRQSFGGDSLVITAGKFAVTDIFDTNAYAHDPGNDFLNWAIIDSGAFDYAADAWGFTYGAAAEWTQAWWTLRAGFFDLSRFPNTTALVRGFGQYEVVSEFEVRHEIAGQPGKVKLLGFVNRGRMGSYADAVALAAASNSVPDIALVRRPAFRPGAALNIEQQLNDSLGAFARLSWNDGSEEAFDFTEINRSLAAGLSLKGTDWSRPDDTVGVAGVVDELSRPAQLYFAAGGMGILIGDGHLRYGTENILEMYYRAALIRHVAISFDYQFISDPAYTRDRGPVSIFGFRLHTEF
ncbi:MAG: carbohydrate porin [Alphaproteobacteria bacterium]|nr:carbohydrate porin [Alphaproteobacteria bacterium]